MEEKQSRFEGQMREFMKATSESIAIMEKTIGVSGQHTDAKI